MPISKEANESSQFYFWFFPSENPAASDEILIWLNGGVRSPNSEMDIPFSLMSHV